MPRILSTVLALSSRECRLGWCLVIALTLSVAVIEAVFTTLFYLFAGMLAGMKDFGTIPFAGWFIGGMSRGEDISSLARFLVAVVLVRALLSLGLSKAQATVAARDGALLARSLLERYLRAPFLELRERPSWYRVRNISNSVEAVFSGTALPLAVLLAETLVALSIFVVLLLSAPLASAIAAAVTLSLATIVVRLMHPLQFRLGTQNQELAALQFGELSQAFSGLRETKVFAAESFFVERFRVLRDRITVNVASIAFFAGLPRILIETVFLLSTALVVTWLVASGEIDAATLSILGLFAYAGLRLMPSAARIVSCFNLLRLSQPALLEVAADHARWEHAIDQPTVAQRPNREWQEVRMRDVSFAYPGRQEFALAELTFSIRRGEAVGIVGRSGAGKSTLVDLLLGLIEPTRGRVTDEDGVPASVRDLCGGRVAYVPQQPILLDASARQNIAFGVAEEDIDDDRVIDAAHMASLDDVIRALPEGFHTGLGEQASRLSGGQRQRIAIARALYREPRFIVLDEATSALDAATEAEIADVLEKLKGRATLVIVAHRAATLLACDRVLVLEGGRLVAQGTYAEVSKLSVQLAAVSTGPSSAGTDAGMLAGQDPSPMEKD